MVTIILSAALPFIGHTLRDNGSPRCDWDGIAIDSAFRVHVITMQGESHSFCCVLCAAAWVDRSASTIEKTLVTDETSGLDIAAADAFFVRSSVPTNEITGNRWHTFRTGADAQSHADATRSRVVSASDSPLAFANRPTEQAPQE